MRALRQVSRSGQATCRITRAAVAGLALVLLAGSIVTGQGQAWLGWTASQAEGAGRATYVKGRVGGFFDTRFLKTERSRALDLGVALGELPKPPYDPSAQEFVDRGLEHEARYVESLVATGLTFIDVRDEPNRVAATRDVLTRGVDAAVGVLGTTGQRPAPLPGALPH